MKPPAFWYRPPGMAASLLRPLGGLYAGVHRRRFTGREPARAPVPVICVGNLTAGGTGKTPVVIDIARRLVQRGQRVAILSRGYGGRAKGPVLVDPDRDDARLVGDEPLLLSLAAPTWVGGDRVASARSAVAEGAEILLMDDGFQNPGLAKDLSLVVVDGEAGFGNGEVMPAGPLREPLADGLARADALVVIGEDRHGIVEGGRRIGKEVLVGDLIPDRRAGELRGAKAILFAGIGRPEKFFRTAESLGIRVVARYSFPDHHRFTPDELMQMTELAVEAKAELFTTAKDYMRLTPEQRDLVRVIGVTLAWSDPDRLERLLDDVLARPLPSPGP